MDVMQWMVQQVLAPPDFEKAKPKYGTAGSVAPQDDRNIVWGRLQFPSDLARVTG